MVTIHHFYSAFTNVQRFYKNVKRFSTNSKVYMIITCIRQDIWQYIISPRRHKPKNVTRRHKGEGGQSDPSTFDTNHPIDLIFDAYNDLTLYFQLVETTRCLTGFHGNQNHVKDVTSGHHLGFSKFQIFFIFELNTENSEKTTFSDWNPQNCKVHC